MAKRISNETWKARWHRDLLYIECAVDLVARTGGLPRVEVDPESKETDRSNKSYRNNQLVMLALFAARAWTERSPKGPTPFMTYPLRTLQLDGGWTDRSTVVSARRALQARGWLEVKADGEGRVGPMYRLVIPDVDLERDAMALAEHRTDSDPLGFVELVATCVRHDAWANFGNRTDTKTIFRVWAAVASRTLSSSTCSDYGRGKGYERKGDLMPPLSSEMVADTGGCDREVSGNEVARQLRMERKRVLPHLRFLREHGAILDGVRGWYLIPDVDPWIAFDRMADHTKAVGQLQRIARAVAKDRADREDEWEGIRESYKCLEDDKKMALLGDDRAAQADCNRQLSEELDQVARDLARRGIRRAPRLQDLEY